MVSNKNLSPNWSWVKLGDLCDRITKGSTPTSYGYGYQPKGIKFIKTENINQDGKIFGIKQFIDENANEFLKRSKLKCNDFLFSIAGTIGRVGKVTQNDLPANTNQALAIIRLKSDKILHSFIFYYLRSSIIQKGSLKKIVGVGRANLSLTNVSDFDIPLPPLPEQKKIVEKIEELLSGLESGIASLKKAKEQIKLYRQSVLASAFNGKLIGNGNIDEKTGLPKGWQTVTLSEVIFDFKRGPFGSAIKKSFFVEKGYKVYEQKNAIYKNKNLGSYFIDEKKYNELENFSVKGGDHIVSCSGTIGKIYKLPSDAQKGVINQALLRLRLKENKIDEKYFLYIFESELFQKRILVESRGSAMKNLAGVKELKLIEFILPPLNQQTQIVEEIEKRFSEADNLEKAIDESLTKAEALRQSILKKAFEGKLV